MARNRITAPELEQFVVKNVQLTGVTLGAGAYGSVEEVNISGARVAAKKLHPQLINLGSPQQVHKWVTDFVEECKLMSQLHHPHIVQFLGVCYLPESPIPVLLLEKLQTSLDTLLETSPDIPLDIKVHLLTGTVRGVVYLHSHTPPIAHRDLTARNILIDSGLTAKIADLGVARMVNIQPGQLAATMTAGPGNNLYMPPESVQEEEATRYNTAIDIFSFGVVSLFTLTQTFPKDLKPHNYLDPTTRQLVARTEVERREQYIQLLKETLGEEHSLVKLTLDCLEYAAVHRPPAVDVLGQLEAVGKTLPQSCIENKLELISRKKEVIKQIQLEHKRQLDNQFQVLQSEKKDHIRGLEELTTLQQQQLEAQRREIQNLKSLNSKQEPQEEGPLRRRQREAPIVASLKKPPAIVPSSITFNWRRYKDVWDRGTNGDDQPVAFNGRLYTRSIGRRGEDVFEYTPGQDQWAKLPPPPGVSYFTIATLRGHLLVVGGTNSSTDKAVNTIFAFDTHSKQWVQPYPIMPTAVTTSAVVECLNHLIVAGGRNSEGREVPDVNILTISNKWITAKALPRPGIYSAALTGDSLYLVGFDTETLLRAHVPTLLSGADSGVWESLRYPPFHYTSPVTIGNTLLTVGGSHKKILYGYITSSIHMYNPNTNKWTKVGDLPRKMRDVKCVVMNSELFVLSYNWTVNIHDMHTHIHAAKLTVAY